MDSTMADEPEDLLQQDWAGDCYRAAVKWINASKENDWVLVHGSVMSHTLGKRIDHAWCERGELVVDLAQPIGQRLIERGLYYRSATPEISRRYPSAIAMLLSIRNTHFGPWGDSEQLPQQRRT